MNFTSTLPTQPGFYAWKPDETWDRPHITQLFQDEAGLAPYERNPFTGRFDIPTSGLWCRLVPADDGIPFHEAYLRIRQKLNAWNTPHAPTREQIWQHTEDQLNHLVNEHLDLKDKYNQLIMAVARKFDGESRHETALRYINEAETPKSQADCAQQNLPSKQLTQHQQ